MGELESMTGHGSGRVERGAFAVDVVLRSVNHRHLDLRSRADDVAVDFLPAAEARVRAKVGRGRVDLRVCVEGRLRAAPTLDVARAEGALEQLRALRDRLAPEEPVPLTLLQSVPGLFREAGIEDRAALEAAITEATDEAIESFRAMRACEGKALATELMRLTGSLRDCVERLREEAPALVQRAVVRLRARVEALLEQAPDERRMAQEIALLAERSDVLEELARLDSHLQQFETALAEGGAVGRRLEFLLQEMVRETNTVGAKVHDAKAAALVIDQKSLLESLREQAHNVA